MGAKDQGADPAAVANRWQVVPRTLCFITYQGDLLLMKRSLSKRIFPGHYNGVGGHIERDEDPRSGAIREIKEETGLSIEAIKFCGSTLVDVGQSAGILLFIFTAEAPHRDVVDSDEGQLEWLSIDRLLQSIEHKRQDLPLVEDLPILLPYIFGGGDLPFFAHVSYDDEDNIQFKWAK